MQDSKQAQILTLRVEEVTSDTLNGIIKRQDVNSFAIGDVSSRINTNNITKADL